MRLTCPCCGERDSREFSYKGAATWCERPAADAGAQAWDDYLHNRDNPAGETEDLWHHVPCGEWVVVRRDTLTHAVVSCRSARAQPA